MREKQRNLLVRICICMSWLWCANIAYANNDLKVKKHPKAMEYKLEMSNKELLPGYIKPKTTVDIIKNIKLFLDSKAAFDERFLMAKNFGEFFIIDDIDKIHLHSYLNSDYATYEPGHFEETGLKYLKEGKRFSSETGYSTFDPRSQARQELITLRMVFFPEPNKRVTGGVVDFGESEKKRDKPRLDQIEQILGTDWEEVPNWIVIGSYSRVRGPLSEYEANRNSKELKSFPKTVVYQWQEGDYHKRISITSTKLGYVQTIGFGISYPIKKD